MGPRILYEEAVIFKFDFSLVYIKGSSGFLQKRICPVVSTFTAIPTLTKFSEIKHADERDLTLYASMTCSILQKHIIIVKTLREHINIYNYNAFQILVPW